LPEPRAHAAPQQVPVRWGLSAHARRLLTLALAGLVIAVITGRPEFAGLAAPAVLLLATLRPGRPAEIGLRVSARQSATVEGADDDVRVTLEGQGEFDAEAIIDPADGIAAGPAVTIPARAPVRPGEPAGTVRSGGQPAAGLPAWLAAGPEPGDGGPEPADEPIGGDLEPAVAGAPSPAAQRQTARLPFVPERWGDRSVGLLRITLRDRFRLTEGKILVGLPWISCRPLPAQLSSSIVLSRLPSRLGEHPARASGEGAEFAGVRPFVPGDRQRRINWPATTRHGALHLSTFAAERIQNLVVIADATADVGEAGFSSLDLVLRGAAGAMTRYLAGRDRVGLIVFGSRLSWIGPGQGQRHFHRLIDLLVSSRSGSERAPELARLPRAALPPGALILVFSPLLDPRLIEAVRDLRERAFTVLVIDVLNTEPGQINTRMAVLARRIWRLEQQAIRFSLTQIGVPVVHWDGSASLDDALAPYSRRVMVAHR
jgi:uncharacterized protein (DUF58 family)